MKTLQLFEMYREAIGKREGREAVSEYLGAKRLGISQSTVSHWKRGGTMDDDTALKIADYCGLSRGEVLAYILAERSKSPQARRTLEALARMAHNAAAAVFVAVFLGLVSVPAPAAASFLLVSNIHYAKYGTPRRRKMRTASHF